MKINHSKFLVALIALVGFSAVLPADARAPRPPAATKPPTPVSGL